MLRTARTSFKKIVSAYAYPKRLHFVDDLSSIWPKRLNTDPYLEKQNLRVRLRHACVCNASASAGTYVVDGNAEPGRIVRSIHFFSGGQKLFLS